MSSGQSNESEIRRNLVENDLVDCMVALPGQLFYATQIPVCLWFLARDRRNGKFRDRRGEILSSTPASWAAWLTAPTGNWGDVDIARIATTYHTWRSKESTDYADVPGFCKSATLEEVSRHGHVLTPGRYVGAEPMEDDGEPFEEKMARLTAQWQEQQADGERLDVAIAANLAALGFGRLEGEND